MASSGSSSAAGTEAPAHVCSFKVSCMDLGGCGEHFMTNPRHARDYQEKLPRIFAQLSVGRDIVGLTGFNTHWYNWLVDEVHHEHESAHDGDNCAIFWRPDRVRPRHPENPGTVTRSFGDDEINMCGEQFSRSTSFAQPFLRSFSIVELPFQYEARGTIMREIPV